MLDIVVLYYLPICTNLINITLRLSMPAKLYLMGGLISLPRCMYIHDRLRVNIHNMYMHGNLISVGAIY